MRRALPKTVGSGGKSGSSAVQKTDRRIGRIQQDRTDPAAICCYLVLPGCGWLKCDDFNLMRKNAVITDRQSGRESEVKSGAKAEKVPAVGAWVGQS